jgi:hypothetical protein
VGAGRAFQLISPHLESSWHRTLTGGPGMDCRRFRRPSNDLQIWPEKVSQTVCRVFESRQGHHPQFFHVTRPRWWGAVAHGAPRPAGLKVEKTPAGCNSGLPATHATPEHDVGASQRPAGGALIRQRRNVGSAAGGSPGPAGRRRSIKKGLTNICLCEIMTDGFDSELAGRYGVRKAEGGRQKAEGRKQKAECRRRSPECGTPECGQARMRAGQRYKKSGPDWLLLSRITPVIYR